ncbi:MAG: hypothetical protein JWM07_652 [Candidatus Saccharibacteria bacterium]|nr:hypothetical protein [Candidatus Saccharibacteria bacterium]
MTKSPDVDEELLEFLISQRRITSREQIQKTISKVAPVIRQNGELRYIFLGYQDVHHVSFLVNPSLRDAKATLQQHSVFSTLHRFAFSNQFIPTIAEVGYMFPIDMSDEIVAFETIGPESAEDLQRQRAATEKGFHVASTVLYTI